MHTDVPCVVRVDSLLGDPLKIADLVNFELRAFLVDDMHPSRTKTERHLERRLAAVGLTTRIKASVDRLKGFRITVRSVPRV